MTLELFNAIKVWLKQGIRSVKIEMKHESSLNDPSISVETWCYDYETNTGKYINSADELPDTKALKAKKIKDLECQLEKLKKET